MLFDFLPNFEKQQIQFKKKRKPKKQQQKQRQKNVVVNE